jgi:TPR repeat protein
MMAIKTLKAGIDAYENSQFQEAIGIFKYLADEQDDPDAIQYLYLMYKEGDGVEKDLIRAEEYKCCYISSVTRKAENRDSLWMLKLADIYQYGDGIPIDNKKAFAIFEQLAEQGVAEAQYELAVIYEYGKCGQTQDLDKYFFWLNCAVDQCFPDAMYKAATLLLSGNKTADDYQKAKQYLLIAKQKGFWPAAELLEKL